MSLSNEGTQSLATLALELLTTAGGQPVRPSDALAGELKSWSGDLQRAQDRVEAQVRASFDSGSVSIQELRFADVGASGVTAIIEIVTSGRAAIEVQQFARGVAELPGIWRGPFEDFLRHVTAEPALDVVLHRAFVTTGDASSTASGSTAATTLTKRERTVLWVACGIWLLLTTAFVVLVLHGAQGAATVDLVRGLP